MKRILHFLSRTDLPARTYVWRAAVIAFIPSIMISIVVTLALPHKSPTFDGPVAFVVFSMLILSPWIETLLMWPILWVLKRFTRNQLSIALGSMAVWAILHSLASPAWGLIIAWPFFIFSVCFLEWEKKSKIKAIVVTALVHTCQNAIPVIAVVLSS